MDACNDVITGAGVTASSSTPAGIFISGLGSCLCRIAGTVYFNGVDKRDHTAANLCDDA